MVHVLDYHPVLPAESSFRKNLIFTKGATSSYHPFIEPIIIYDTCKLQ